MWVNVEPNINAWDGRANAQAEDMIPALADHSLVDVYLSAPPFAFADWAFATGTNWGSDQTNVVAEKPFGASTGDADDRYDGIVEMLPDENLKIVDHWLSFFMIKKHAKFPWHLGVKSWSVLGRQVVFENYHHRARD